MSAEIKECSRLLQLVFCNLLGLSNIYIIITNKTVAVTLFNPFKTFDSSDILEKIITPSPFLLIKSNYLKTGYLMIAL